MPGNGVIPAAFFLAVILLPLAGVADAHTPDVSTLRPVIEQQGWLDPVTRRYLQIVNIIVAVVLLGLATVIFILWYRLRDKVRKLEIANRKLREQGELLRLATEATPVGIWDFYPVRGIGFFSDQWYRMFGYPPTPRPMPLSEWRTLVHPDDRAASERVFMEYAATGRGLYESELRVRKADGAWCWVIAKGRAITWNDRGMPTRIIGMHLDMQKIKDAQEGLAQSEDRFRTLFKMAPLPMIYFSLAGKAIDVNDSFTQVLGYAVEDVPTVEHCRKLAHPVSKTLREGASLWDPAADHPCAGGTGVDTGEYRVTCRDGTVRDMIVGASRAGRNLIVTFFDITELRRAEAERANLQEQLLQSRKLEAVGNLAGGVAHDFNNMLGVVIGYAELALKGTGSADPLRENLDRILEAAQSSAGLTRQLLAFARKQALTPVVFDVNGSVGAMLNILRRLIGENITLEWAPFERPCTVRMDRSQLQQILTNLCVNARDAIADVGTITIGTGLASFGDEFYRAKPAAFRGEYVVISVGDSGCGMDRDTIEHIFEPFFTTKGLKAGTGLGLATVYGIVNQNDGFINVESEPGRGTVFRIYFPSYSEEAPGKQNRQPAAVPHGRGETILVVEDNPLLLKMSAAMLRDLGYGVMRAARPSEALRLAQDSGGAIDLFITDVVMPEMSGLDLAIRLKAVVPRAKHIFMSGYPADVIADHGVLTDSAFFLQKPYTIADLAAKIREALD